MVSAWLTSTTDAFPRPDSAFQTLAFPGAASSLRFEVRTATMIGVIRLALQGSP